MPTVARTKTLERSRDSGFPARFQNARVSSQLFLSKFTAKPASIILEQGIDTNGLISEMISQLHR
jgi:hypothetical protein